MNLTIDIGNTSTKWATFEGARLTATGEGLPQALRADSGEMLACVSGDDSGLDARVPRLAATMPLPIKIDYQTPATLGPDRVAAACGAWSLHRGEASVVIDAGTCTTVDFVDAQGVYHGGAIMPGLGMNLQALHTFTAKLPLVDISGVERAPVLGRSTEECILAGTVGATVLALAGFVALYRERCATLHVVLTGGYGPNLAASGGAGWEWVPQLTLIGLNEIIMTNER